MTSNQPIYLLGVQRALSYYSLAVKVPLSQCKVDAQVSASAKGINGPVAQPVRALC